MNPDLIALFRELADRPLPEREAYYEAHHTPAALRADVELLLQFDDQNAVDSFAGHVASAAIKALFPAPPSDGDHTSPPAMPAAAIAVTDATFIGRYHVARLLGRGGMAEVYLARDPVLDREVAVKLIAGPMDENTGRRRLIREARAAGRLQHPNIVTIFDAGEHEGRPYIAMEYVSGETLRSLIQRRVPMPLRQRLQLFEGACAGLAHAHRAGVVHLDIKPDNLMVDESGTAKVLDFGIARVLKGEGLATKHILGTLRYMSPEQIAGDVFDHRSDIFSLGCALFEFLSYAPAYSGSTKEIVYRIASGPVPSLASVLPDIDPRIDALVARAMALEPGDRFQDLEELRAELASVGSDIAGDVVPAIGALASAGAASTDRTSASPPRTQRLTRSQSLTRLWRSPLTASIAAGLVLATGAGSLIWGAKWSEEASPTTPAARVAGSDARPSPSGVGRTDATATAAPASANQDVWRRVGLGDRAGVVELLEQSGADTTLRYEVLDAVQRSTLQRRDTARTSAAAVASQPYRDAAEHVARAERLRNARQPVQALRALWQADDLFIQALTAAGRPPVPDQTVQNEAGVPTMFVPTPIPFALPPPTSAVEPPGPTPSATPPVEVAAAARTPAKPDGPAVAAVPTDRELIVDALNRYNAAYRLLDVNGVLQVYPTLGGESLAQVRRTFEQNRSYEVDMSDPVVQVDGATARVSATLSRRIVPRVGNPVANNSDTEFRLRRDGSRWVITSVAAIKP